jgi:hypothetical protein
MADFDSLLDELRAVRADGQWIPSYSVDETAALVDGIEQLRARVAELEAQQGAQTGIEWGVRYPTGTEVLVRDEREAWERASVRPGRTVVNRAAPGPWRVTT